MSNPYVSLARSAIDYYLEEGRLLPLPADTPQDLLKVRAGAFVTLYKAGKLRGCIGTIQPVRPSLAQEIIHNAVASATEDPRFPPLREDELDDLVISVDVLGAPQPIDSIEALDPGRYGVIVTRGFRKGLLLPMLEGVDQAEDQVAIALQKAGIYPGEAYDLERFEVVRYEEGS